MPENTTPTPAEGFRVYRTSPLPSGIQPLVILSWRTYPRQGDLLFDLLCFVTTEERVLQAKGVDIYPRSLRQRRGEEVSLDESLAFLLDKAQEDLESQARHELTTLERILPVAGPLALNKLEIAEFQRLAARRTWAPRWAEIRALAPYTPLKSYLEELDYSPLLKVITTDLLSKDG